MILKLKGTCEPRNSNPIIYDCLLILVPYSSIAKHGAFNPVSQFERYPRALIFIHGLSLGHAIPLSAFPLGANSVALGVRAILASSVVSSLREEISLGSFVLLPQIINKTKGIQFFEGTSIVVHARSATRSAGSWLERCVQKALEARDGGIGVKLYVDPSIICMEDPQFSTRTKAPCTVNGRGRGSISILKQSGPAKLSSGKFYCRS